MKKEWRNRTRKWFALMLAVAMMLQQSSLATLAAELETTASTGAEAETKEETEATVAPVNTATVPEAEDTGASGTTALETEILKPAAEGTQTPETKAPETQAPETQAAETKAPETQAPETKAPETQAPETKAPETKAPETQAPETKAPEAQTTGTATPPAEQTAGATGQEQAEGQKTETTETPVTEPATEPAAQEQTEGQKTETTETTEAEPTAPETKPTEQEPTAPETEPAEQETVTEAPTTEPTEQEPTEQETVTEAPATEPATEQVTEPATQEQTTEALAETETETEEETEKKKESPTSLTATCSGVTVRVNAAKGVLAPGTELVVIPAGKRQALEAIQNSIDTETTTVDKSRFLAFDISLQVDGKEVQPNGQVTVSFDGVSFASGLADDEEIIVAHVNESAAMGISFFSAGKQTAEISSGLSINATHFSFYAVAVLKHRYEELKESEGSDKSKYEPYKDVKDIEGKYTPQNQNVFSYTDDDGLEQFFNSSAFDFHIFAEEAEISEHTNGNVAANVFHGGGKNFGTQEAVPDGVVENNYFGESVDHLGKVETTGTTVFGKDFNKDTKRFEYLDGEASVYVGPDGTKQGPEVADRFYLEGDDSDEKYIDVTGELNKLSKVSKQLAAKQTSENVTYHTVGSDQGDITVGNGGKINYLNVSASDLCGNGNKRVWNITMDPYTTLVINVNMAGANLNALQDLVVKINGKGNGQERVRETCNVLWNFYVQEEGSSEISTYTTDNEYATVGNGEGFLGTILAPDANILYGAVNGSIIARRAKQNGKESHNWRFTGFSVLLNVTKTLYDDSATEAKTFYFAVYDAEGKNRVPDQYVKQLSLKNGESGSVQFAGLNPGTYTVFETDASGNKLTDSGYIITGNGQQVKIGTENDEFVSIVNSKENKKYGSLRIIKNVTVNGEATTSTLADGSYTFAITELTTDKIVRTVTVTIRNGRSNSVSVEGLEPGAYTVREITDNNPSGMHVVGDNVETVIVYADGETSIPTISFTNNRGVQGGTLTLTKEDKDNAAKLAGAVFDLYRKAAGEELSDTKVKTGLTTGEDGTVTVYGLQTGTYYFVETQAPEGYKTPEGSAAKSSDVEVTASEGEGTPAVATVTMQNEKANDSTSVTFSGTKTLENKTLTAGTFSFTITEIDGSGKPLSYTETVTNGGDGSITFSPITYTEPGTHRYRIEEVHHGETIDGITYASTIYYETVTVTYINGKLQYSVSGTANKEAINFTNTYQTAKTSLTFKGQKTVKNADGTDKATGKVFNFDLYEVTGATAEIAEGQLHCEAQARPAQARLNLRQSNIPRKARITM